MRTYIIKRLLFMVFTMVVITMVSYTIMRLAPGDPARTQTLGGEQQTNLSQDRKESAIQSEVKKKYYLDRNVFVGYCFWLRDIVTRFDWGTSIIVDPGTPVMRVIAERLPPTLKLNIIAIILIYTLAVPIGIHSALRQRALDDRGMTVILFILYSLPSFWVGVLLIMFFGRLFPVAGLEPDPSKTWGASYWTMLLLTARHYVLPVFCMTYSSLAGLSRYARVGLLEVLRKDYVRTARAKGLSETQVILKHVLRNGVLPLITLFAGLLPGLIGGSIVVEYIFSIPGMGSLSITALNSRDYPLMMALFSIGASLTLIGILLSDLLYAVVDPRITYD